MAKNSSPFAKLAQDENRFPPRLHGLLREVTEASSPKDEFQCYCNFVEALAKHLAQLANSEYKNRAPEQADEALEAMLRASSGNLSFGHYSHAIRTFASRLDLSSLRVPELADVLRSQDLPAEVIRQIKAFQIIRSGRTDFEVPPHRLRGYVEKSLPGPKAVVKGTMDDFLAALVEFRNRGLAHQDEDGWFPNDKQMYMLVVELLEPSLEALLAWQPLRTLLTHYEIVEVDPKEHWVTDSGRACRVRKRRILPGLAPLGRSEIRLPSDWTPRERYVAKRTSDPRVLEAVQRAHDFPTTVHSSEQLHRRYARQYLALYLEHGLVTPAQRENLLDPLLRQLSISTAEVKKLELAVQQALNDDSDDEEHRERTLERLRELLGSEWRAVQTDVSAALEGLNDRRHAFVFDLVNNSYMMSFDQLRAQTELKEVDLQTVLVELEQEGRVRRVGPGGAEHVHHSHFKAQDPRRAEELRSILRALDDGASKRKYPAPFWDLLKLCEALLAEDGLSLNGEVDVIQELFERAAEPSTESETGDLVPLVLLVDDIELRADSVRDLFEKVWKLLADRKVDTRRHLPYRLGRTRYLVNTKATHANGTPFGVPCPVGRDVFFEGNLPRSRALREVRRFLGDLGVLAPGVAIRTIVGTELDVDGRTVVSDDDSSLAVRRLHVSAADGSSSTVVEGNTLKGFLGSLMDDLVERGVSLDSVLPVRAGRIKYFLAEEPYHSDGQEFEDVLERQGYYFNTGLTFDRALELSQDLCGQLGLRTETPEVTEVEKPGKEEVELRVELDDAVIEGKAVPAFLVSAVTALYERGALTDDDIPLKVGRVRYLLSAAPRHDHGREFIRPVAVSLGGHPYFIEANVSRAGALEIVRDLLASKGGI